MPYMSITGSKEKTPLIGIWYASATAVIITGWGKLEAGQHQSLGATPVLTKPFDIAQVLQVVGEISRRDAV